MCFEQKVLNLQEKLQYFAIIKSKAQINVETHCSVPQLGALTCYVALRVVIRQSYEPLNNLLGKMWRAYDCFMTCLYLSWRAVVIFCLCRTVYDMSHKCIIIHEKVLTWILYELDGITFMTVHVYRYTIFYTQTPCILQRHYNGGDFSVITIGRTFT